jgi:hypothetical protein
MPCRVFSACETVPPVRSVLTEIGKRMNKSRGVSQLDVVPLTRASLCLDCEMITAADASCRVCGSAALLSVARALSSPGRGGAPRANLQAVPELLSSRDRRRKAPRCVQIVSRPIVLPVYARAFQMMIVSPKVISLLFKFLPTWPTSG